MNELVILAIDGSDRSQDVLQFASKSLNPKSDEIIVVSVAEELPEDLLSPGPTTMDPDGLKEKMQTSAEEYAHQAVDRLQTEGFDVNAEVRVGKAGEEICNTAEQQGAQQIILGKRGRSEIQELLLGSTTQYVLHHAGCAVTVLPE